MYKNHEKDSVNMLAMIFSTFLELVIDFSIFLSSYHTSDCRLDRDFIKQSIV